MCHVFDKILYCIRKYFIMCDVQTQEKKMIWKVGVSDRPHKVKNAVFLAPIIVRK